MRFMCGARNGGQSVYLVEGDQAYDLGEADERFCGDMTALFGAEAEAAKLAKGLTPVPVSSVTPALPIIRPGKVICLGLNYVDHIKEGGYDIPTYPALFMRGATSLIPAGAPMVRPSCSEQLDYEAEMMVIIGEGGGIYRRIRR